ncbi:MAG TPA: type II toxin-antitoxin system VapC family toxin [Mycobacteriales bacterium]
MIVYFDTSAFVPLLVVEVGTPAGRELWETADEVAAARLLYVETAAALARARRLGRLGPRQHRASVAGLDDLWQDFRVLDVDDALVVRAAELADRCALRGYDAVHCASAERIDAPDLVVASGDKEVLAACADLGLATALVGG